MTLIKTGDDDDIHSHNRNINSDNNHRWISKRNISLIKREITLVETGEELVGEKKKTDGDGVW